MQKDIKNDESLTEVSQIGSKYSVKYDKILSSSEYVKMLPIIEYIEKYGCITTKEAMELTGKSNSSARRYLPLRICDALTHFPKIWRIKKIIKT